MKQAFLIGERVQLRPVEAEDMAALQRWGNDPALRGLIGETRPMTAPEAQRYYERLCSDPDRVWFIIEDRETGQPVGECGLLRMFPTWRTTDLSIILAEPEARGKGYGREAIHLLMDYAFGYLNFHRISIGVVGFNEQALRFYEKIGFKHEGIQRDGYYYNHRYSDFVMMSILEDEFRALNPPVD